MESGDFLMRLRPLPSGYPVAVRLRRVLKALLRSYQFRCVSVAEIAKECTHPQTAIGTGPRGELACLLCEEASDGKKTATETCHVSAKRSE